VGALLRLQGRVRNGFWSSAASACTALVLGFATMPKFGAYGAVLAMLVADIVRITVMTRFLVKPSVAGDNGGRGEASLVPPPPPTPVLELRR
jgi:hypothetical protein